MGYRNGIFATIALALSSLALAGVVSTEEYAHAARSEASGLQALTEQVVGGDAVCAEDAKLLSVAPLQIARQ
ncbi:MAG: hypothetical protein ACEQSK_18435 [Sphingomonadaceae bacterium]